jgi:multiple sugar transport system ATP-binding protein
VTVDVVEELGADAYIYGSTKAHLHADQDESGVEIPEKPFIARVDGRRPPQKGEMVYLAPNAGHVHVFDAQSGERLGD